MINISYYFSLMVMTQAAWNVLMSHIWEASTMQTRTGISYRRIILSSGKKPHQMKCNSLTCKMLCLKTNSRNFCSENFCSLYLWLETCFCTYWSHMNQQAKGTQNILEKAVRRYWISPPSQSGTQMLQIWRDCGKGLGDKVMKNPFSETFICLTSVLCFIL